MKYAMPLTAALALFAVSACGEDDAKTVEGAPPERAAETASAPGSDKMPAEAPAKSGDVAAVTPAPPTPMPEPAKPIITFASQDGRLALGREALTMVSPVHDAASGVWSVFVQLDEAAAADFYTLTTETAGEALAVVVDDMTVSTPVLETAVYGGGFVFGVDDSTVASAVVAALKGEPPTRVQVAAEDALEPDGTAGSGDSVAQTE